MATEKKTTAAKKTATKATEKKAETKTAAKTTAKKAETKTDTKAAAKKTTTKKTTTTKKAASKVEFFVEFGGVQVSIDEVIKNVQAANGTAAKNYTIYLKPEESKAYYVADGEAKEMDVYFVG